MVHHFKCILSTLKQWEKSKEKYIYIYKVIIVSMFIILHGITEYKFNITNLLVKECRPCNGYTGSVKYRRK